MDKFIANLQNELFKLRKRKKYLVFLLLGCAVCVAGGLRVLVANFITGELGTEAVSRTALLGNLMNSNLTFILLIFLPLMAIMASCDLFVGEQADHTMRFSLMRPVSKGKLFFSKAGAVFLLCAVDLAVMYAATTLTQLVLGGGTRGVVSSLFACLLDLIPLAVLILFFCLVNQLVKGSSLAVLLCVVLYIGFLAVGTYLPAFGGLLFTGYLRWHNLWIGVTLPLGSLLSRMGLLAGYSLVFACGGYMLFDRKES